MKIAAVVLDMDGTMIDTEPIYKASWQQATADLGYHLDDLSYAALLGRSVVDGEHDLARQFGDQFPLPAFRARWPELWRQRVAREGIPTKAGLFEFLSFVEEHKLPVAVATSSDRDYAHFSLEKAGVLDRFRIIVTGDEVTHGKPAPDIYLEAARRLNVAPARCVALEDSNAGILAASRAGMVALHIPDLRPPSPEAAAAAYRVLPTLNHARDLLGKLLEEVASGG